MTQEYIHPAFPQPSDLDTTLWRYLDIGKFNWLVKYGRLYMPSADQLGDPFEGTTPQGELDWWKNEAENADSDEQRNILIQNRKLISNFARKFRTNYFVSCWHMNRHENRAMWRCYTRSRKSVAIRTTYVSLRDCLQPYVNLGIVRYIDYNAERLPTMNMFEYIMHKEVYYSYEYEVRAVVLAPPVEAFGSAHFRENLFESQKSSGQFIYAPIVNLNKMIQGVVLHPEAPKEFVNKISELCSRNGLPQPERSRKTFSPVF